ncbi:hypothetical protein QQF64_031389 [Cirrhinus molitorella]|uniref:Uncharacterized protein n=1 Tax=Cirrhinus molitorella TaxID=172907 RepID=A0ABR3MWW2_9TELE
MYHRWPMATSTSTSPERSGTKVSMTREIEAMNRRRAARPSTQTPPDRVLAFTDTLLRVHQSSNQTSMAASQPSLS